MSVSSHGSRVSVSRGSGLGRGLRGSKVKKRGLEASQRQNQHRSASNGSQIVEKRKVKPIRPLDLAKSEKKTVMASIKFEEIRVRKAVEAYNRMWERVKKEEKIIVSASPHFQDKTTKKIVRGLAALDFQIKKFTLQDKSQGFMVGLNSSSLGGKAFTVGEPRPHPRPPKRYRSQKAACQTGK